SDLPGVTPAGFVGQLAGRSRTARPGDAWEGVYPAVRRQGARPFDHRCPVLRACGHNWASGAQKLTPGGRSSTRGELLLADQAKARRSATPASASRARRRSRSDTTPSRARKSTRLNSSHVKISYA